MESDGAVELSGGEADYDDGGGEVDASPSAGESGGTIQDDGLDDGKSDGKGAGAGIGLSLGGAALGDDGATQDNDCLLYTSGGRCPWSPAPAPAPTLRPAATRCPA